MNIYLLSQEVNNGYDTFDSMVVIAHNEEEAKRINPSAVYDPTVWPLFIEEEDYNSEYYSWARPEDIKVILIGKALPGSKVSVVCASFNPG
jgi:hypothetical protein